jgi:hypothetical protein
LLYTCAAWVKFQVAAILLRTAIHMQGAWASPVGGGIASCLVISRSWVKLSTRFTSQSEVSDHSDRCENRALLVCRAVSCEYRTRIIVRIERPLFFWIIRFLRKHILAAANANVRRLMNSIEMHSQRPKVSQMYSMCMQM